MSAKFIPPCYGDFDRLIKNLFDGYGFGELKVKSELPVGSQNGKLVVRTSGTSKIVNGKVEGMAEMAYSHNAWKITEKVNEDGMLKSTITNEDQALKGLKGTLETVYNPDTNHKSLAIRTAYKRPYIHHTGAVEFDFLGKVMRTSLAVSYPCGGMLGGEIMYETTLGRITSSSVGAAYNASDFTASVTWQSMVDILVSVHQRISPRLQVGAQFMSSPHRSDWNNLILGMRYQLDDQSHVKAKISSQGTLGLAYNYRLTQKPFATVTLSALIDTRRLNQPAHRLGASLQLC
ncbi:voltage-dependent anion-selective channel protein 2-like [Sycon ciliatum]|uniref:voltage-dependent anion-selective channel protein 2-like n=1 Tax=Sycon ciliatum TaxID=27933 RepID=UPI0020AE0F9B|eukprot:scpid12924/ scgid32030/ Voltage-dependent anion-selective channel protein 2; Outer mitochondrial membrane protein porin